MVKALNDVGRGILGKPIWPRDDAVEYAYGPGDVNDLFDCTFHRVRLVTPRVWSLFCAGELHGAEWEFMAEDGTRRPHGTETPGD
jgi:hypothetical protein